MMHWDAIANAAALPVVAYCLALTLRLRRRMTNQLLSISFVWIILAIIGFVAFGNVLEHGFANPVLDPLEEYLEITLSLFYMLFVLSFVLQEGIVTIRSQKERLGRWNEDLEAEVKAKTADLEKTYSKLANARVELIKKERTAALAFVVRRLAHLINTPLGICVTTASLLGEGDPEVSRDEISGILGRNLRQISDLIGEISRLNEYAEGRGNESFDVAGEADRLLSGIRKETGGAFEYDVRAIGDARSPGPRTGFQRVVREIAMNAVVHNPGAAGLRLDVEVDGSREGECAVVIADNGRGIDEELGEKVFDPFFTPTFSNPRPGMGLFIAQSLAVHVLGGRLASLPGGKGRGAAFRLVLPKEGGHTGLLTGE